MFLILENKIERGREREFAYRLFRNAGYPEKEIFEEPNMMKAFFRMPCELPITPECMLWLFQSKGETVPRREEKCILELQVHGRDCDSCNVRCLSHKRTLHPGHLCLCSLSAADEPLFVPSGLARPRSLLHVFPTSFNYIQRTLLCSPLF